MHRSFAVVIAALPLALVAACGLGSSGADGQIVVGSISSRTGAAPFVDSQNAAEAVFDQINEKGGVKGHKIKFVVKDDGGNAAQAATAARELVESDGAVGLVNGQSLVDCSANAAFYKQSKVRVVSAGGFLPGCYNSDQIAVVDAGPFISYPLALYYLSNVAKKLPVCLIQANQGIPLEAFQPDIDAWKKTTGKDLTAIPYLPTAGPAAAVAKAKSSGCKGMLFGAVGPTLVALYNEAASQGLITKDSVVIGFPNTFTSGLGKELGPNANYSALTPVEPFTANTPQIQEFSSLMESAKVAVSDDSLLGYLAAKIMINALENVTGDYTNDTVAAALGKVSYETPLLAEPFKFQHQSNSSAKVVKLDAQGNWQTVDDNWVTFPPK